MKRNKHLLWSFLMLAASMISLQALAQDDLYYDPATDAPAPTYDNSSREENHLTQQYREDDYYDEDEYAYEYSSRIRRFHRPSPAVVDYYDPFYVDMWNYDPFYLPGATIYVGGYNDYWTWRRWNRWQRYNRYSFYDPYWGNGFNSWGFGWNRPWGYSPWNNMNVYNNYYYDPYWTYNGYNPYYCQNNAWVNNSYYYNNNNNGGNNNGYKPKTYTG
ncbi:MAG: hypothetical protein IT260_09600, partial [Saprospiraceae bacterium]|nr:hypothetical protein [Saprospiraceae bacterium]